MAQFRNRLLRLRLFRLRRHLLIPDNKQAFAHAQTMNTAFDLPRIIAPGRP
ncbi:MAG: hypothetical protein FWG62_09585 [Proteobacteria bacterium]|nr:hypothetical protein [Pseudomonadota bacterium]